MSLRSAHWITAATCASVIFLMSGFASPEEEAGPCDSPLVGGHTGAPGESSCTGCHAGTANSGAAVIEWNIGDGGTYVPGTQYTATVKMKRPGREKFGFSCLALQDAGNVNLGGFSLLETVRTRTYADGPRDYVSHTPCGADAQDSTEWSFTWQAPATNVGPVTIYMANLVANHSHSLSGDETYTRTITLTPSAVGIANVAAERSALNAFPNPSTGLFQLRGVVGIPPDAVVEVHDAIGRLVRSMTVGNVLAKGIDLSDEAPGPYMAQLVGDGTKALKLVVER